MALFAVLDRPTVSDSVCALQPGNYDIESGYLDAFHAGSGTRRLSIYPHTEIRIGVPGNWEIKLYPPNYNQSWVAASGAATRRTQAGFGDAAFGAKYEFGTFGKFTLAADTVISLPTGDRTFSPTYSSR